MADSPGPETITSILSWGDRHFPATTIMDQARAYAASGVVDDLTLPDHMSNFFAPSLWNTDNTPMAAVLSDPDSLHDAFIMGTLAHVAAPEMTLSFACDAIRRPPAEMSQTMLSMASLLEGRVRFMFGAGEMKQCKSFGHKRTQGLSRQRDLLNIFDLLWKSDGPINYSGQHWEMRNAYLGGAKPYRPELWVMGTGPKQIEQAIPHVDGICSVVPGAWHDAEHVRKEIADLRARFTAAGRDGDAIKFGAVVPFITHEDSGLIEQAMDNPITRWFSATFGRISPPAWREVGLEPATPEGWTYFMDFAPYLTDREFVDGVVAKTSREMVEHGMLLGSPTEVGRKCRELAEAGINYFCLGDFTALMIDPADAPRQLERLIEVCRVIKHGV